MWNVRNFVRHDNNILNPRTNSFNGGKDNIRRYEFPLMQWLLAQPQKIIGENIVLVRILLFLIGVFSLLGFFLLSKHVLECNVSACVTTILLMYSPIFYFYQINPIPDNLALCCGIWYLFLIVKYEYSKKNELLFFALIFLLISTLVKLPFIIFGVVSFYFSMIQLKSKPISWFSTIKYNIGHIVALLPALAWYLWVIPTWSGNPVLKGSLGTSVNPGVIKDIIAYHISTMFPFLLLTPLVWFLVIFGFWRTFKAYRSRAWLLLLLGINFVYLFFEFVPIGMVHDYYMMPFLPALYLISGFGVHQIWRKKKIGKFVIALSLAFTSIYTPIYTSSFWSLEKSYYNKDAFIFADELKSLVHNDEKCIVLNDNSSYIFSYLVDKMGYMFKSDYLPIAWVDDMVRNHDVEYMYSDSKKLNESVALEKYIDRILFSKNSIKVFKLKIPESNSSQ